MKVSSPSASLSRAWQSLEEQHIDDVIRCLEQDEEDTPDRAERHALLALAYFLQESYEQAARHYEQALALSHDVCAPDETTPRSDAEPRTEAWRAMLDLAAANAAAEIDVPVPAPYFFDREKLLAVPEGALPSPVPAVRSAGLPARLRRMAGHAVRAAGTLAFEGAIELAGRLLGHQGEIWTTWYHRPVPLSTLVIGYMRKTLNAQNLRHTYPVGTLTGFAPQGLTPPAGVSHFRTADGSWNNLADPKEGAALTRFSRNIGHGAICPEADASLMSPNPRVISRILLTRDGEMKTVPFLNMLAVPWIQFQSHDWISHGEAVKDAPLRIPLSEDDPVRLRFGHASIAVGRTQPDPTREPERETTPVTFINEVTHWWDGSQIYGSDQSTVDRLRSRVDGKLRLQYDGRLPIGPDGVEETGFVRNWWVGLSLVHTLFAREHNAICDHLQRAYPAWDDTRLFSVARLINAAVMAKIHTIEWTPAILPNLALAKAMHTNWYGALDALLHTGATDLRHPSRTSAARAIGALVGNPINKHQQPYGLTEEFAEVYRLHSLLPETLIVRSIGVADEITEVPLARSRQAGAAKLTRPTPLADLFYSFGLQQPGQLVLNNFPTFMQEMSIPGTPVLDLAAADILRARERGVPRYNEFRRQLGLRPLSSLADLTDDPSDLAKLKQVYGDDSEAVERLDLMIGTLAEARRPTGFGFGETLFHIFILNASRRLQADRFYTDCYNEEVYSPEGLDWIDDASLKKVLLRHHPELADTGLANVKNAFEPWDTDERLDPQRHPLRAFDRQLRPDPWLGDAWRPS
jgi:hypothetical protein